MQKNLEQGGVTDKRTGESKKPEHGVEVYGVNKS